MKYIMRLEFIGLVNNCIYLLYSNDHIVLQFFLNF